MAQAEDAAQPGTAPPYIAFQSLKTLFAYLQEHGLPGRIDRSVLTNFSGSVGGQIITALRFLRLIDAENRPMSDFQLYVNAYGTDVWPEELGELLRKAYSPIFELDLETASPSQFNEQFRSAYPNKEETLRKCITFFLNASREAQIPISPYIMKNLKPRSAPSKKRGARDNGSGKREKKQNQSALDHPRHDTITNKTPYQVLMNDIYDPAEMHAGSEEERAVFTLARYLKMKETS